MKMTDFLPMMQPLDQANQSSGYMRRPMTSQDSTDSGIVERIMYGAKNGFISQEVTQFLLQNLLDSDAQSNAAIRGMAPAPRTPEPNNVIRKGLLSE